MPHALILAVSLVFASGLGPQTQAQSAITADAVLRQGVALHDKGLYDEAIRKYEEAIALEPENDEVFYELAYSYQAKRDLAKAIDAAQKGLQLKGPYEAPLCLIAGTLWDEQGETHKAVEAYEAGIQLRPDDYLLHFNLGVTLARLSELSRARQVFERALALAPNHPGSLYGLGQVYLVDGYPVPALLALSRFLFNSPNAPQADAVRSQIDGIFRRGYVQDPKTGNTTITLDPHSKKDEGDFSAEEAALLIVQAGVGLQERGNDGSEAERTVSRLADALQIFAEVPPDTQGSKKGFAAEFLVPFFIEMHKRGLVEAYSHIVYGNLSESRRWIDDHRGACEDLRKWSEQYSWNRPGEHQ